MNNIYKIRSKDGLFSTGSSNPSFSKKGTIWTNIGHVKTHYQQLTNDGKRLYKLLEVEIVEYQVIEVPINYISLEEFEEQIKIAIEEKNKKKQLQIKQYEQDQKKKLYEQLKKEFENDIK